MADFRYEGSEPASAGIVRDIPPSVERLNTLRCLVAVARHGSTMRAADAIHLSQPAVTRAILELERFLGVRLFDRGARGMVPTALGTQAARRVEFLLEHLAQGAAEAFRLAPPKQRRAPAPGRFAAAIVPASLKAFLAIAACTSESKAAAFLGISQPAVHRSLRALEHLCGAVLFQKSAHGTRLTEGGDALLRRVKLATAEARAMEGDIAAWRGEIRGRVVMGTLPLSVSMVAPQAVAAVMQQHPEIEITVIDGTYESLMRQLRSADIDLIVGALRPGAPAEVSQELLFIDALAIVARPGHPCLAARRPLKLKQLLQWDWVVPLPATPARAALDRAFGAESLAPPKDRLQATSAVFTKALVAGTDHLALASLGQALEDERAGLLRIVPLALSGTRREIGFAIRSMGEPSPDLQVLLEALRVQAARWRHPEPAAADPAHKRNEYLPRRP